MEPVTIVLIVLGIIALIGLFWFIGIYNALVRLKNQVAKSWSNIDVLLKQRTDELTKLIDTVKGYMKHEKSTLENITKARSAIMNASSVKETADADNMLTGALKTLFAVAENYPDLKANQNFIQLQQRITGIENQIADRREFYNDSVNIYNIKIESFPDMIVARMMGYQKKDLFRATEQDKQDVKVEF